MKKILYHGSDVILKKPLYGVGKEDNDYGSGFYTTEDIEKAFDRICFEDYENVSMDKDSHYGEADAKARREVGKFLYNREYAIQINGFKPAGLTVKDVISTQYEYNKEYGCYLQEERANERNEFEIDDR